MSAGREDAPPALHGREFTIKTEDGQLVVVGVSGPIRFEDEEGNEMGISTPNVPYTTHDHSESGMASAQAVISDSSISAGKLADRAVTSRKVAGSAVTGSGIAPSAVDTGRLAHSAVDSQVLAPSAVGTGRLAHSAVDSQVLAPSAVGTGRLADSAVTAGKIADSAVKFDDGEKEFFGTGDDVTERFDAAEDELKWRDELSGADRMSLARATGNLTVAGTLDETSSP